MCGSKANRNLMPCKRGCKPRGEGLGDHGERPLIEGCGEKAPHIRTSNRRKDHYEEGCESRRFPPLVPQGRGPCRGGHGWHRGARRLLSGERSGRPRRHRRLDARQLGLRVRSARHRLRRRGHVGVAHRRRRVRPGSDRAGEGPRARRRKQLHQQRRVDHRGGGRQAALQGLHSRLHQGQDPGCYDRGLGRGVRPQHRVRRQVRHDLRSGGGGPGRRHPRVLLPGRQRLRGLLQAVLGGRLRHAVLPRAGRPARAARRAGAVRLP